MYEHNERDEEQSSLSVKKKSASTKKLIKHCFATPFFKK